MALTINYVPGYTFTVGEVVTIAKLNLLANPTINLEGAISGVSIGAGAVGTSNIAVGALSADAPGRALMANSYFSADATGRAKFTAGFFGAGDATSAALFADGFFAPLAPCVGSTRNLIGVQASNTTATVTADEAVLKDANASPFLATAVNVTVNTATSGANGLDTGVLGASQWYYFYLIYNGTTVASLISSSATTPTLPGGYTYKALVSAVYSDASSHLVSFYQQDRDIWIVPVVVFTAKASAGTNTYESYSAGAGGSDVNLTTVVPPIAKRLRGCAGNVNAGSDQSVAIAGDGNGLGAVDIVGSRTGAALDTFSMSGSFAIPMKTAQTFFWKSTSTSARNQVTVNGFSL